MLRDYLVRTSGGPPFGWRWWCRWWRAIRIMGLR